MRFKIFMVLFMACIPLFSQEETPNILFIMSDDHSAETIGVYASRLKNFVKTPNIDRLGDEGAIFNNVQCTNALCAPSRATIITGKYSHKSGVFTLRENLNTLEMPTVPKVLQSKGYQTAVVGKWHVHGDNLHGFDYYAVTRAQGSYWNPSLATISGGKIKTKGYVTDVYTDLSIQWLENRNKRQPFFLMTHYKAAHAPWEFAKRHQDMYKNVLIPEPKTLYDNYMNRAKDGVSTLQSRIYNSDNIRTSLSFWFNHGKKGNSKQWPTGNIDLTGLNESEKTAAVYQKYIKDYLRVVKGIDEGVGRLLDYLESQDELDNTIIIYTSDQGMYLGEHGFFDKRLGLNEAVKMPLLMRYPKLIKSGTQIPEVVNNVDYAETLIDMANVEIPKEMQGYSFWKLAQRKNISEWPRKQSFYGFYSNGVTKHYGLITKEYKLLKYIGKNGELLGIDFFDRIQDENELVSVADNPSYAKALSDMEAKLAHELIFIDIKKNQLPGKRFVNKMNRKNVKN
jgi:arylsulfatase A-like enzyme